MKKSDFAENELVIYQNGDKFEVGKIKRLCEDGAFVWYHLGDTAAKTPYACLHKISNAHALHFCHGLSIKQLAPILLYCTRLSRLVSPADAQRYYGMNHDGAISDFLGDLGVALEAGNTLSLDDEFYNPVYGRICENVESVQGAII